jgi:hypothetical protein
MKTLLAAVSPIENPVIPGFKGKPPEVAFGQIVAGLVGLILVAASLWTLFQLILAGLNWINSGGDKSALEGAQQRITNAITGLFIVFAAWVIFLLFLQFFGIMSLGGSGAIILNIPKLFQ